MEAIDLFAGAGGLSLGLKMAGWDISTAIENDEWAATTHKRNFPTTAMESDVRDIKFDTYQGIDLIAGGPPCQPFSVAGKQLASDDPRDMVPEFIRAVTEAKPRAFIMENVPGLLTQKNADYIKLVLYKLRFQGYSVYVKELDAADYGVPQHRKRVFIVGFRDRGIVFQFPKATHGPHAHHPYISVRQALAHVPACAPNRAKVTYAKQPILRRSPWAGMLVNGQGRPLNPNAPGKTIPASAGGNRTHIIDSDGVLLEYHRYLLDGGIPREGEVEGVRRLNVRESARLQSFPDEFAFAGPASKQYSQIGNAVPPLLAFAVANAVFDTLNGHAVVYEQLSLLGAD